MICKLQNNDKYKKILLDVSDWFHEHVERKSVKCIDRFEPIQHPLVISGKAFWVNEKTLCIGYQLK